MGHTRMGWVPAIVALALALAPRPAAPATTLFVDTVNASCSDSGAGSATQPFCTIGAAAARATAGQIVQVASGTYVETVTVANSGTSDAPIVFTAAPGASVTVTGKSHGFTISGRSWITVQGFNVTATTGDGVDVSNGAHITLTGNHVSFAGQPASGKTAVGISLSGVTDSLVSGNTVDHNSDFGIYLLSGSTRITVLGNQISNNARGFERAAAGIDVYASPGNTFQNNVSHHNEDSGIEFRSGATNNLVVNNVTYLNGDHGIDVLNSTGQRIVANSVYKNVTAGINVEGTSSGATLANNVSVDNGINSPRTHGNVRVDSNSTSGTALDYDQVFLHQADTMIVWGSTSYSSLAAFVSATGKETHGLQADPRWVSPDGGDLHLTAGSPAIDSANSGASGQSPTDADGNPRVDDPAIPNTGAGPRAFDDRGAYEFLGATASTTSTTTPGTSSTTASTAPLPSTTSTTLPPPPNLVGNPGFETDTAGWDTGGSGSSSITLSRVAGGHSGSWAAKLTNTGASTVTCVLNDSPNWVATTSAGTYTGGLWVRADTAGAKLRLRFREYTGSTLVASQTTQITLTTAWQPVTVSYTPTAPGVSTLDFNAYVSRAAAGTCFYADDATITNGAASTTSTSTTQPPSSSTTTTSTSTSSTTSTSPSSTSTSTQPSPTTSSTTSSSTTSIQPSTTTSTSTSTSTSVPAPPNLVGNPGFETSTTGWNTSGSGSSSVTLSRVAGGHSGGWSAQVTNAGTTAATSVLNDSPNWVTTTSAGTYTGGLWVRADEAGATLKLRFREYDGGGTLLGTQTTPITLTTGWQLVTVSYVPTAPGASTLDLNAYVSSAPMGTVFYADDASIIVN